VRLFRPGPGGAQVVGTGHVSCCNW
jgi:hypothetical protein